MNLAGMRPRILGYFQPIFTLAHRTGLSPNAFTSIGLVLGLASVAAYSLASYLMGAFLLLLVGLVDLCDGYVARITGRWTLFGGVYEGLVDRYVNALILAGITVSASHYGDYVAWIGFFAVTGSLVNSFSKVATYAETQDVKKENGKIHHPMDSMGFFGLAETIVVIMLFSVVSSVLSHYYMVYCLAVVALCTHLSLAQRILFVYRNYNRKSF